MYRMNQSDDQASGKWFAHRKRVVAKEVRSAAGAAIVKSDIPRIFISGRHPAGRAAELVLDPSALGERHRKRGHTLAYRVTATTTIAAMACGLWAIISALMDDAVAGRLWAIAGLLLAIVAVWLSRQTRLSARLRGYAYGAGALGALALGLCLCGGMIQNMASSSSSGPSAPPPTHEAPPPHNAEH
jgi:hypothetical protein